MVTTLMKLFAAFFDRDLLLTWARELGAVVRLRDIHPQDFCAALVGCAIGDEERSIASARRLYFQFSGKMPEESSFFDRFSEEMSALLQRFFRRALDKASSEQRGALARALGGTGIVDILAADATQVMLPRAAADVLPSTSDAHGGFKLTAILSLMFRHIQGVALTDARAHDRQALKLRRWLHGQLYLFDRGYSDYRLFDSIARRGGFFVTRLKKTASPTITSIRSGLGQAHVGSRFDLDLPFRCAVDLDAKFRFRGGTRILRVVRVTVEQDLRNGVSQLVDVWLVTNLSPALFNAQQIATLYRMRWSIEILFRALKTVGRLDQLRSSILPVIQSFIFATLIGALLSQEICAQMRRARPGVEPSDQRVMMLVLANLPRLIAVLGSRSARRTFEHFVLALWREGVNPNPGRPYVVTRYARELKHVA
jgi:putative transposase